MTYDVLVVGSGVAGMESALKLGDMGYRVLVVEETPSIGGRMVLLSKVFPTLDCASCIATPKMGATAHHQNVTVLTDSEVSSVLPDGLGSFHVRVHKRPRFVDTSLCTGCRLCEEACTVSVPDHWNGDLVARRAAYIAFPQAVPMKAVVERAGTSPCSYACPAGIKAHGYLSLVRSGMYEEAFDLVLEATPLVGTLGRACYAPCETSCTRSELEGPVPLRRLKRFIADRHYANKAGQAPRPTPKAQKVAVVGSGPAGLTAAWQLARRGYGVKVFEAAPEAGGFLRYAIPAYRLPAEVVDQDIQNLTDIGVEIATNTKVDNPAALKQEGYEAVLLATGTPRCAKLGIKGEHLQGVIAGLDFLRAIRLGEPLDLKGKRVVVVGGGNVAMDAARSALRLGASETVVAYRRARDQMPAHASEVAQAESEGVAFRFLESPVEVIGEAHLRGLRCLRMSLGDPDASGRARPEPVPASEHIVECDILITAVGLTVDPAPFESISGASSTGYVAADPKTLQTRLPHLFAAGDVVTGPTDIANAVGQGQRAAYMIDRWLQGLPLVSFPLLDDQLEAVTKPEVLARQQNYTWRDPLPTPVLQNGSCLGFDEIEGPMSNDEALGAVSRCLDCGVCSECHQCSNACPAEAINLDMRAEDEDLDVGAVIISTGYKLFPADAKPQYGYGKYPNVITAMQMDRLLAPTRPYNTVLRPSDGKVPERIAYVMCTGSRDQTVGNPLCSKFCCMYSLKQNQLILGALPLADVTVHYIDIRAAGKGYDEFFEQAKAMGTTFLKGRVASITETEGHNLVLRYEDIDNGGGAKEAEYDLVVLAVGVQPNADVAGLFGPGELALDNYGYMQEVDEDAEPATTSIPGVFLAGSASGPKDIPESILHAGAAVVQAAGYLERRGAVA